jgi:hypothetical protein
VSGEQHDYEILRERLEAEGFTIDPDTGVHCNYFWAQTAGTTPEGRPFYYRLKYGTATLTWTDLVPDLSDEHAAEDIDDEPNPDLVAASLHRLITAAGGRDA